MPEFHGSGPRKHPADGIVCFPVADFVHLTVSDTAFDATARHINAVERSVGRGFQPHRFGLGKEFRDGPPPIRDGHRT